jgi:hypothetical protein
MSGPPKAVSDDVGSVYVFNYSRYGELDHKAWNQTVGVWTPNTGFENLGTF